jgi:hypothetical protein
MFGRRLKRENEELKKGIATLNQTISELNDEYLKLKKSKEELQPEEYLKKLSDNGNSLVVLIKFDSKYSDLYLSVNDISEEDLAEVLLYNFSEEVCFNILDYIGENFTNVNVDNVISLYNSKRLQMIKNFLEVNTGELNIGKGAPVVDPLNPYAAEKGQL